MAITPSSGAPTSLPSAFQAFARFSGDGRPAVFLDYDGTLTPIVTQPAHALLTPSVRRTIQSLTLVADVGIISGRQLDDLVPRVDLHGVRYAGSHGIEVLHANGHRTVHGNAAEYVDDVRAATQVLERLLHDAEGVLIERKRFSVAVHYRLAPRACVQQTSDLVFNVAAAFPRLQVAHGKEVLELRPQTTWNKGAAVTLLAGELESPPSTLVFIGDDFTDENAFSAIEPDGIGIAVGGERTTAARFTLAGTADVHAWLDALVALFTDRPTRFATSA